MVEAGVGQALRFEGCRIGHHAAGSQRLTINHGHHPVESDPRADLGPVQGGNQGLGQGQTTGLNHDSIELVCPFQKPLHGGKEVFLHGAAEAAIGQLHQPALHLVVGAEATAAQQVPIDADLAEFVDQHSQPLAAVQQQMAQQGCFPGTQKSGHHGDRKASAWVGHLRPPARPTPRCRHSRSGPRPASAGRWGRAETRQAGAPPETSPTGLPGRAAIQSRRP